MGLSVLSLKCQGLHIYRKCFAYKTCFGANDTSKYIELSRGGKNLLFLSSGFHFDLQGLLKSNFEILVAGRLLKASQRQLLTRLVWNTWQRWRGVVLTENLNFASVDSHPDGEDQNPHQFCHYLLILFQITRFCNVLLSGLISLCSLLLQWFKQWPMGQPGRRCLH